MTSRLRQELVQHFLELEPKKKQNFVNYLNQSLQLANPISVQQTQDFLRNYPNLYQQQVKLLKNWKGQRFFSKPSSTKKSLILNENTLNFLTAKDIQHLSLLDIKSPRKLEQNLKKIESPPQIPKKSKISNYYTSKFSKLPNVRQLKLSKKQISNIQEFARQLSHLRKLQRLDLSFTRKSHPTLFLNLRNLSHLRELDLTSTEINQDKSINLGESLPYLSNLKLLRLGSNPQINILPIVSKLNILKNLKELDLNRTNITNQICVSLGENLSYLNRLKILNLAGNQIGDEGFSKLVPALSQLLKLQSLDFSVNELHFLPRIEELQTLANLKYLKMPENNIGETMLFQVVGFWNKLELLDLNQNQIGPGDLEQLLPNSLQSLRLYLGKNSIGDEGCQFLGPQIGQLRELNLNSNGISDRGLVPILEGALPNKNIEEFRMANNQISNRGALWIAKLFVRKPTLQFLDLRRNPLSLFVKNNMTQIFGGRIEI